MLPIRDNLPRRSTPIATWAILTANVVLFAWQVMLPEPELVRFFHLFGVVPARITRPEWAASVGFPEGAYWPFLTSMFLHGGIVHVFGNMWTLWIFGDNVEDRMGSVRFAVFYLLCGVLASFAHAAANPLSTVPALGASGAIAGVLGAYFLLFPAARIVVLVPVFFYPLFFELPALFYLAFWLVSQVLSGAMALTDEQAAGGVAWWAHIGGFAAGLLLHRFFLTRRRGRRGGRSDDFFDQVWTRRR